MNAEGKMKGIEPIIAVVILVAVTLVIAIGVVGWIMGWWGTVGATESLRIYPDSSIIAGENPTLELHIKNEGSATSVIYKIEIVGIETYTDTTTIPAGQETTITATLTSTGYSAGTNYFIKVYTRAGNVVSTTVQAR
ncbi:MAG: archaellin/type IV pilin N-terminal domain-containing protein [Desulfurococcaceae archaeon]